MPDFIPQIIDNPLPIPGIPSAVTRTAGKPVTAGFVNSASSSTAQRRMTTLGIGRKTFATRLSVKPVTILVNPD